MNGPGLDKDLWSKFVFCITFLMAMYGDDFY